MSTSGFESYKTIDVIHNMLIADLLTGFNLTKDEKKFKRWKGSFKQVCKLPAQQDCPIEDDISYLEINGLLEIGNYDKLIEVLDNVDKRAVEYVKEAMKEIQKRQGTLNSEAVEEKKVKKEVFNTEIRIAISNQDDKMQKEMSEFLHQLFKKRESDSDFEDASNLSNPQMSNEDETELASDMSERGSPRRVKINGETLPSKEMLNCVMRHSLSLCDHLKKCKGIKTCKMHLEDDVVIRVEFEKSN